MSRKFSAGSRLSALALALGISVGCGRQSLADVPVGSDETGDRDLPAASLDPTSSDAGGKAQKDAAMPQEPADRPAQRDGGASASATKGDSGQGKPNASPDAGTARDAAISVSVCPGAAPSCNVPTTADCTKVGPVPDAVRQHYGLDPFYKKYTDANGIAVLSSAAPDDRALLGVCHMVNAMLAKHAEVRQALIANKVRFAIIGQREGTADIPEYGYRDGPQADIDYINRRARGLEGQTTSCGEENILCLRGDRYASESICLHEFAHTLTMFGYYDVDPTFEMRLGQTYMRALNAGSLRNTYRAENSQEYWAEGVQDYYDTNTQVSTPDGVHNSINTRSELLGFDAALHALVEEVMPDRLDWEDCHRH